MTIQGAGTSEGWEETGRYRYACKLGCYDRINHPAWIVWCPKCGEKMKGPQVT